jgi:seryl-tRNA synthetase
MLLPEDIARDLVARGELWDSVPGLSGMRGTLALLRRSVSLAIGELASQFTEDEWQMPRGVSFDTLERASYFESFPQWLSGASHLSGEESVLERIATSVSPGDLARQSFASAKAALPPAVCYHTYEALRGKSLTSPVVMTAEETCWRHEGARLAKLERGWAFTMREIVCLADPDETETFRQRGIAEATSLAASLGLSTRIDVATDPFFAPSARGKAVLQRVKALKHELLFDYPDGRSLAIASFNNHELFFGDAFDLSLAGGSPAASACIAFGIERWVLAILMTHGVEQSDWPDTLTRCASSSGVTR